MLGLRLAEGIPASLARRSGVAEALAWGRSEGLVTDSQGRAVLTRRGRLLSNELFARLL